MPQPIFDELYTRKRTGRIFEIICVGEVGHDPDGRFSGGILIKKQLRQVVQMKQVIACEIGLHQYGIVEDDWGCDPDGMPDWDELGEIPADCLWLSCPLIHRVAGSRNGIQNVLRLADQFVSVDKCVVQMLFAARAQQKEENGSQQEM